MTNSSLRSFTPSKPAIQTGVALANAILCRDHFQLTIELPEFAQAEPGQFVHVGPERIDLGSDQRDNTTGDRLIWDLDAFGPLLRRAYSIAGFVRNEQAVTIEIVFRVVGTATRWMAGLKSGDLISVLGPLGNRFPIHVDKAHAWMISGGVGLPPMLWLAEALRQSGRQAVAFCGAQTRELVALQLDERVAVDSSARKAVMAAREFSRCGVPVVLSTDDGSIGFRGFVGNTMMAYHTANLVSVDDLVVYTCGPEAMMRQVAEYCVSRKIQCYVCMERSMACGLGTCQSCVVPVHDTADADGWRYQLCCTEGPVFDARDVIWGR